MAKVRKYLQFIIWGAVTLVLVGVLIAANVVTGMYAPIISIYLHQSETKLIQEEIEGEDTEYFKSEYKNDRLLARAGEKLCEEIVEEGAVLLENKDGALPLESTEKNIHFFSLSSYDFVTGGVGSGSIDDSTSLRLRDVFNNYDNGARFVVNSKLWDYYYSNYRYAQRHYAQERQGITSGSWEVGDIDASTLPADIKATYKNSAANDIAVTVISRMGGEGSDLPHYDYGRDGVAEGNEHFLQLTTKEKNTLKEVGDSNFKKHIVIINSSNPIELGWINDPAYGIDAVMLVANVGKAGMNAIPSIFAGDANPSGRLVDTWAFDALSSPAAQNMEIGRAHV